jgi:serine/threonine protein phosphatase PrpC
MMEKGEDFLEEYSEPIQEAATPLLSVGEFVQHPEGNTQYQIQRVVTVQGWLCPYVLYEVREIPASSKAPESSSEEVAETEQLTPTSAEPEATEPKRDMETPIEEFPVFWLWEAGDPERVAWLRKEADIFSNLDSPLFPKVRAQFAQGEKFYLVTEPLPEKSLEASLQQKELTFPDFLLILTQVAQGLVHLHQAGWVHSGLQPSCVLLGKPVRLVDLRQARRRDETELDAQGDVGVDVFSVGAILYRFIRGGPLLEAEISLTELQCRYVGVPQILHRCIGPKGDRYPNLQVLHEDLKRLRRRYMPNITYNLFGATTIGLEPSRTTNEDAYGYLEGVIQTESESLRWLIACVADGMGGMEAGEVASEAAVKTVLKEATKTIQTIRSLPSSEEQARWVKDWVHKANESVCEAMKNIYLFREGDISLLTRDHSLAAVLALQEGKAGDLQYIRSHPDRNRLTRSLGERIPLPDYFVEGFSPEVTQNATSELQDGDILLLCSDGVWEPVTEEDMVRVLQKHGDNLSQAAFEILDLVLQRGARDNATVLLVSLKERQPVEVIIQAGGEKDAESRPQTSSNAPEGSDG